MEQRKTPLTEEAITREEYPELEPIERERELVQRILGVAGSLLLVIAPFATLLSTAKMPRVALFQQARMDALVLLVVALIALGLCSYRRYGFLWVSGAVGVFEIINLSSFLYAYVSEAPQVKTGVLGFLGRVLWSNAAADWGTFVLLAGTILSLGAAAAAGFKKHGLTPAAKLGVCLLVFVAAYQAFVIFYPQLRYAPYLFRR